MSLSTKPTKPTSIEDLPSEMICELFKHLRPKHLAACSMVNKHWHSIYSEFKVHSLVAIGYFSDVQNYDFGKWYSSERQFEPKELCQLSKFRRLLDRPLVSNLKHLAIFSSKLDSELDVDQLNGLSQLVHLEINLKVSFPERYKKKVNLNLPRLNVLALNDFYDVSIDCPDLSVLMFCPQYENNLYLATNYHWLHVKYPETIRKLHTTVRGPELAKFKNVDCLVTERFEVIGKSTLLLLPRLKELHYNENINTYSETDRTLDEMKRAFREFLDDVKRLRGSDFKFTFAGFLLTKTRLAEIDFGVEAEEPIRHVRNEFVYMKNWPLLDPNCNLDFIHNISYDLLMSSVVGEIPMSFFRKFTGVHCVVCVDNTEVGVFKDEKHFLQFLGQLSPRLRELSLKVPRLSQGFCDQLPTVAPWLMLINLQVGNEPLSFDCMRRFPRLVSLNLNRSALLDY